MLEFRGATSRKPLPHEQFINEIRASVRYSGREVIDALFGEATTIFASRQHYDVQRPGVEEWGNAVLALYKEALKTVADTSNSDERAELKNHLDRKTEELAERMICEKPGPGHFWTGRLFFAKGEGSLGFELLIEGAKASVESDWLRHSVDYAVNLFQFARANRPRSIPEERMAEAATELTELIRRKYGYAGNYWIVEMARIGGGTSQELASLLADGAVSAARNADAELALANLEKIAWHVRTKRDIDAHVERLSGLSALKGFARSEQERSERLRGYADVLEPLVTDLESIFDGYVARARDDRYRALAYTYKARVKETVGDYSEAAEFYEQAYAAIGSHSRYEIDERVNVMLRTVGNEDPQLASGLRERLLGETREERLSKALGLDPGS